MLGVQLVSELRVQGSVFFFGAPFNPVASVKRSLSRVIPNPSSHMRHFTTDFLTFFDTAFSAFLCPLPFDPDFDPLLLPFCTRGEWDAETPLPLSAPFSPWPLFQCPFGEVGFRVWGSGCLSKTARTSNYRDLRGCSKSQHKEYLLKTLRTMTIV